MTNQTPLTPKTYALELKFETINQIRLLETMVSRRFDDLIEVIDQLENKIINLKEKEKEDANHNNE